jgi:hypothetical protein
MKKRSLEADKETAEVAAKRWKTFAKRGAVLRGEEKNEAEVLAPGSHTSSSGPATSETGPAVLVGVEDGLTPSSSSSKRVNLEEKAKPALDGATAESASVEPSSAAASSSTVPCLLCKRADYDFISDSDLCIAHQLDIGCHACGKANCFRTNPQCSYFGRRTEAHADAQQTGHSATDLFERSSVTFSNDFETGTTWLNFRFETQSYRMFRGFASGSGCNCLIHSLQQVVNDTGIHCVADVPWVRKQLQRLFPQEGCAQVTARNFLDFKEHWAVIVDLLGQSARAQGLDADCRIQASTFTAIAISQEKKCIVSKEGSGPLKLFVLNQDQIHFVPLLRARFSRR